MEKAKQKNRTVKVKSPKEDTTANKRHENVQEDRVKEIVKKGRLLKK